MNDMNAGLAAATRFHFRRLHRRDLPQVLHLAELILPPATQNPQLPVLVQSRETLGVIAEASNRLAGFAICAIVPQTDYDCAGSARSLPRFFRGLMHRMISRPLQVDLLQVAVAPEWQESGIEEKLLQKLDRELRQFGKWIKITVPETDLPAQRFLHVAGYRAIQVLRDYYTSEDGYLFESR
ncbi:MAG TPA: GNAT family N-acetyltransferase [Gemmataceae bacterium]|nr:GNAT family N-acetyltransferase [Gemmataceae bacterium]